MGGTRPRSESIEGELVLSVGRAVLIRSTWEAPINITSAGDEYHLQLSLLPQPSTSEGRFPHHWGPHRFEPIGDMFLVPAQQLLHTRSHCLHQNAVVLKLAPEALARWFGGEILWTDTRLQAMLDIASPSIRRLMFSIGEELRDPGFATEALVELMAGQVVIELARHLLGIDEARITGGLVPWRMRLIEARLADEEGTPTLAELAGLCNLSVRHLTRAFRISRGRSIGSYIAERRVDHAKKMLSSGMSVKTVAFAAGFTAASNFAAAFRRATGETPRQYRQRAMRRDGARQVH